jgi:phosphoribosylanthranilate isomerase
VRGDRPHIKVCGITRAQDALDAARCGASAIGFVFWWRSPRVVTPEAARSIAAVLPAGVLRVGVFVNALPHVVREISAFVPLDVVQLHGDEPVEWRDAFTRPLVRALRPGDAVSDAWLALSPAHVTPLMDATDPERRGGTGERADWIVAGRLAATRPLILAGGLSAANVGDAIRQVRPYGIDVSSGVEAAPGVKDQDKLVAFFAAAGAWHRSEENA